MDEWSAKDYLTFEDERTRPVRDLLAAVPTPIVRRAIDLGCGPGNSTEVLAARFPGASVGGIDSSPEMIAAAQHRMPTIRFAVADIETWDPPEAFDVIISNAALQWLGQHGRLLPRLTTKLTPAGSLAIQMPDNLEEPAHTLMRQVAASGPWSAKLADAAGERTPLADAGWYYTLLRQTCARVDVWRTVYHHPLAGGTHGVIDWFRPTGLKPYLKRLTACEQEAFLDRYRKAVAAALPVAKDGTLLLPFPRLFIVATR